jgi:hypothetical protein
LIGLKITPWGLLLFQFTWVLVGLKSTAIVRTENQRWTVRSGFSRVRQIHKQKFADFGASQKDHQVGRISIVCHIVNSGM